MGSSETSSNASKSHNCIECGKSYSKPSLLAQHMRTHTNERPFKCDFPDCNSAFYRKSHLQAHTLRHGEEKPFKCSVCGKGVNTKQHLKRHEITHTKSFICPKEGCTESFYKHQSLRHHIYSVHEKSLTCELCNKNFSRPYRLAQHNQKYHSETPVYQCDQHGCFAHFKTWSALQFHIKTEHPKLQCPICSKGCVGKKGLEMHMNIHDEDKMVKLWNCDYCDVGRFVKKNDLMEHYNQYHDGNIPDELLKATVKEKLDLQLNINNSNPVISSNLSRYVEINSDDEYDGKGKDEEDDARSRAYSHASLDSFNQSLRQNHSIIDLISNNYDQRKLVCPKKNCDRRFARDYDLKRHLAWHDRCMQKIESFLQSLDQDEEEHNNKRTKLDTITNSVDIHDDNEKDDDEFNDLIDQEIKKANDTQQV